MKIFFLNIIIITVLFTKESRSSELLMDEPKVLEPSFKPVSREFSPLKASSEVSKNRSKSELNFNQKNSGRAWLAFGDLRGHIEPCGCDPATDLGGVRRIDMILQKEKKLDPQTRVFCLGNLLKVAHEEESQIKNEYILRALSLAGVTATLVGPSEIENLDLLRDLKAKESKIINNLNFLLSNSRKQGNELFASLIQSQDYQIFGYYYDSKYEDFLEKWSVKNFEDHVKKTQPKISGQATYKVLLFRGSKELLAEISQKNIFDTIISGNESHGDKLPGQDEKNDENKLKILMSPLVLQVPLGGQGLLRGGILQNRSTKNIQDLLNSKGDSFFGEKEKNIFSAQRHLVTWLTPQVENSPQLASVFSEYELKIKNSFQKAGSERIKDLASSPYAGVKACKTCHLAIVEIYESTRHARAMDTLTKRGKDQDPNCVSCHSVGFHEKGGFVSIKDSPFLSHVQCENCHGPRKEHTTQPVIDKQEIRQMRGEMAKKICIQCHNPQHSPQFNFDVYWDRIKHTSNGI